MAAGCVKKRQESCRSAAQLLSAKKMKSQLQRQAPQHAPLPIHSLCVENHGTRQILRSAHLAPTQIAGGPCWNPSALADQTYKHHPSPLHLSQPHHQQHQHQSYTKPTSTRCPGSKILTRPRKVTAHHHLPCLKAATAATLLHLVHRRRTPVATAHPTVAAMHLLPAHPRHTTISLLLTTNTISTHPTLTRLPLITATERLHHNQVPVRST